MATYNIQVRGQWQTVESPYTLAEAVALLSQMIRPGGPQAASDFARDLVAKATRGLTEKQIAWVHKLVVDGSKPKPAAPVAPTVSFSGLVALFDRVRVHLKRPRITITVDGQTIRCGIAGEASRYPGTISVTDGQYPGRWFGRIARDGTMTAGRDLTPAVTEQLVALSKDPAGTAARHGRATGVCCFCGQGLKDERSTKVGYGPVCAERYGLPWGGSKQEWLTAMQFEQVNEQVDDQATLFNEEV